MQWHQLGHMQTTCTSLQTDNHTNTLSVNFYRPDALPDAQPTASKHWLRLAQSMHEKSHGIKTARTMVIIHQLFVSVHETSLSSALYSTTFAADCHIAANMD